MHDFTNFISSVFFSIHFFIASIHWFLIMLSGDLEDPEGNL